VSSANSTDNSEFVRTVFFLSYPGSLFHEHGAETLMLELSRVSGVNWDETTIHVELTDHRCSN
jgi:hypothetical protein